MNCDVMLKATNVDGVYTADPKKDPSATRYETITFDEALNKNLKVMDATAFALCRERKLNIVVFGIAKRRLAQTRHYRRRRGNAGSLLIAHRAGRYSRIWASDNHLLYGEFQ